MFDSCANISCSILSWKTEIFLLLKGRKLCTIWNHQPAPREKVYPWGWRWRFWWRSWRARAWMVLALSLSNLWSEEWKGGQQFLSIYLSLHLVITFICACMQCFSFASKAIFMQPMCVFTISLSAAHWSLLFLLMCILPHPVALFSNLLLLCVVWLP